MPCAQDAACVYARCCASGERGGRQVWSPDAGRPSIALPLVCNIDDQTKPIMPLLPQSQARHRDQRHESAAAPPGARGGIKYAAAQEPLTLPQVIILVPQAVEALAHRSQMAQSESEGCQWQASS